MKVLLGKYSLKKLLSIQTSPKKVVEKENTIE